MHRFIFKEDHEKQEMFSEQDNERENYLTKILEEFSPADVRYEYYTRSPTTVNNFSCFSPQAIYEYLMIFFLAKVFD